MNGKTTGIKWRFVLGNVICISICLMIIGLGSLGAAMGVSESNALQAAVTGMIAGVGWQMLISRLVDMDDNARMRRRQQKVELREAIRNVGVQ